MFLGLLALLFHWPLIVSAPGRMIDAPDITNYFLWLHQYARDTIASGHVPLWNPYNFAGTPFAANPSLTVFYPPTWLSLLVPVLEMHRLVIIAHSLLAGACLHLYLRKLGLSRWAVTFACLPWMFGSYFMAHAVVGHLPRIFTMAWLPLVLYLYERSYEGDRLRFCFWTGFALGAQVLAGEPQNTLYTVLLLVGYGFVRAAGARPLTGRPIVGRIIHWGGDMTLILSVAALTSAVQLLPTMELLRESERSANTFEFATTLSYPPRSLVGFLIPWSSTTPWIGEARTGNAFANLNWELAGYVGILTLILAGLSFTAPRTPALLSARLFLFVGLLLMLGHHTPVYSWLFRWLPGISAFRIPARAILLVQWSLAVMSAYGFEWLFASGSNRWRAGRWRVWAGLAVLVLSASLIGPVLTFDLVRPVADLYDRVSAVEPIGLTSPILLRALSCLFASLAVVVVLRWMPRSRAMTLVLGLSVADLLAARPVVPLTTFDPSAGSRPRLLQRLLERGGSEPFRVDLAPSHVDAAATVGQVENVNAYWPLSIGRFHRYVHAMRGVEPDPHRRHQLPDAFYSQENPFPLRLLNVQFASKIDRGGQAIALMQDPDFLPRAWIVDRVAVMAGEAEAYHAVQDPAFDARRLALLEGSPRTPLAGTGTPPGTVTSVRRRPEGGLDLTTESSRDGYLLLSEVYYPGWRAAIDGRDVELERADYLITAMPLPAGSHRIAYFYDPSSFRIGMWSTAFSLLTASMVVGGSLLRSWREPHVATAVP